MLCTSLFSNGCGFTAVLKQTEEIGIVICGTMNNNKKYNTIQWVKLDFYVLEDPFL